RCRDRPTRTSANSKLPGAGGPPCACRGRCGPCRNSERRADWSIPGLRNEWVRRHRNRTSFFEQGLHSTWVTLLENAREGLDKVLRTNVFLAPVDRYLSGSAR